MLTFKWFLFSILGLTLGSFLIGFQVGSYYAFPDWIYGLGILLTILGSIVYLMIYEDMLKHRSEIDELENKQKK